MTGYEDYPNHPLYGVPEAVLAAAREVMAEAARDNEVDPEMAGPLADAVILRALPAIRAWLTPQQP